MKKEEIYQKLIQALVGAAADYIVQRMFEFAQISPYWAIFMAVMIVSRNFFFITDPVSDCCMGSCILRPVKINSKKNIDVQ